MRVTNGQQRIENRQEPTLLIVSTRRTLWESVYECNTIGICTGYSVLGISRWTGYKDIYPLVVLLDTWNGCGDRATGRQGDRAVRCKILNFATRTRDGAAPRSALAYAPSRFAVYEKDAGNCCKERKEGGMKGEIPVRFSRAEVKEDLRFPSDPAHFSLLLRENTH